MLEGLPPNGAEHVVRLTTDKRRATAIVDLVSETFDPSEVAASAFEAVEDGVAPARWSDDPPWLVELYFADAPDEDGLCALIEGATDAGTAALARFETIAGKDWIEASLAGLPPVRAGRVVVHGAHARGGVRAHEIGIEIEAALAFGTGHHGTTMGCLLFLEDELKRRRPRRALDVGTGTGVLAIAAARALRRRIAASDIDPVSVETARANAVANGAGRACRTPPSLRADPMISCSPTSCSAR
jgi:ribosomal protein L11 methyltransferase